MGRFLGLGSTPRALASSVSVDLVESQDDQREDDDNAYSDEGDLPPGKGGHDGCLREDVDG